MVNKRKSTILFGISLAVTVALCLSLGFVWGSSRTRTQYNEKYGSSDFSLFWEAYSKLKESYVGNIDAQKYLYGAISGAFASLDDPYTDFLSPEISKQFQDELSGDLEGVGLKLGVKDKLPTVIAPISDSPAFKAGIKTNDKILMVDDFVTQDQNLDLVVSKIKGSAGTKVKLTILPAGSSDSKEIELTREKISVSSVEATYTEDTAVVSVSEFGTSTISDFDQVAQKINEKKINKVVVDLRSNSGGFLDGAIEMLEYFLPVNNTAVFEDGKSGKIEHKTTVERGLQNVKLAVVVDDGSASAAEIFAGAIKDHQRGKVIGTKTFGKGTVQELIPLSDNASTVKITVAHWLTPSGSSIDKNGIEPDIKVENDPDSVFGGKDPVLLEAFKQVAK